MRYFVTVGTRTFDIDVDGDRITIDGEAIEAELLQVSTTPLRRLSVNGESHRVIAERSAARGEWDLHVDVTISPRKSWTSVHGRFAR